MATVYLARAEARRKLVSRLPGLWTTERKTMSVKDVAAAGGWKDITTLIDCYRQPDEKTLRAVVEFVRPAPRSPAAADVRV
jgi:hypothetical protein